MSRLLEQLQESAAAVRAVVPTAAPEVALVLGSGLAGAVRLLDGPEALVRTTTRAPRVMSRRTGNAVSAALQPS